jgi:hypothetical protein
MKRILLAGALMALASTVVPAGANTIVADGITYNFSSSGLTGSTESFDIMISGINGALDTEGGRFGVQSFAFSTPGLGTPLTGSSTFGAFQGGGLNSGGCDGSGGFFCFSGPTPTGPALAANSSLDIAFVLSLPAGDDFTAWTPAFKINWDGLKNNYDLVSLPLPGGAPSPVQLGATPLPGSVWLMIGGLLCLGGLLYRRGSFAMPSSGMVAA